jgi:RTX calcium-binding nonapeptide repeat (4 copies)
LWSGDGKRRCWRRRSGRRLDHHRHGVRVAERPWITVYGEAGKDILEGGPGKDLCVGGPGKDINRLVQRGSNLIKIPSGCEVKKSI